MKNYLKPLLFSAIFVSVLILVLSCEKKKEEEKEPIPVCIYPANNENIFTVYPEFIWTAVGVYPENDTVFYDVYLDSTSPPKLVISNLIRNNFNFRLEGNTNYYWRVVAKYNESSSVSSALCTFKTASIPGDLGVVVCDYTQINYLGGVEVFLYETEQVRNTDGQRNRFNRMALTDTSDPKNIGAMFYQLPPKKYYLFARIEIPAGSGKFVSGISEGIIHSGVRMVVKVVVF